MSGHLRFGVQGFLAVLAFTILALSPEANMSESPIVPMDTHHRGKDSDRVLEEPARSLPRQPRLAFNHQVVEAL